MLRPLGPIFGRWLKAYLMRNTVIPQLPIWRTCEHAIYRMIWQLFQVCQRVSAQNDVGLDRLFISKNLLPQTS